MAASFRLPCVLVALERERLFLHDTYRIDATLAGAPCRAFLCSHQLRKIVIVETGVGTQAAIRAVDWLVDKPRHDGVSLEPAAMFFAGFAGALQRSLAIGDVIHADDVIDLHGNSWRSNGAGNLAAIRKGRLLTADRFIGDPAEKLALGAQHNALIVDMESAAFARLCHERGVPWACLRVVSDDVTVPFSTEIAGLVEDGHVHIGRVVKLLARKPWILPKLMRLDRQTRLAARRLADAVIQYLSCSSVG